MPPPSLPFFSQMSHSRILKLTRPFMTGDDVGQIQNRLLPEAACDGVYGPKTASAVRAFQELEGLGATGFVDSWTRRAILSVPYTNELLNSLKTNRSFCGSVRWRLAAGGLMIEDCRPEISKGEPETVRRVWVRFGDSIAKWGTHYEVPLELIVATICTESRGKPTAVREEPGFVSDAETPHKVSPGLMQTLISTARHALSDPEVSREWLLDPDHSIQAGTAYIAQQRAQTGFDPPKVACAYNAGRVVENPSPTNRWKMRQYPIGGSAHADRFVRWFNDCFRMFATFDAAPRNSFRAMRETRAN